MLVLRYDCEGDNGLDGFAADDGDVFAIGLVAGFLDGDGILAFIEVFEEETSVGTGLLGFRAGNKGDGGCGKRIAVLGVGDAAGNFSVDVKRVVALAGAKQQGACQQGG